MDPTTNNPLHSRRLDAAVVPWDGEADLIELERSLDALAAADLALEPLSESRLATLATATRPASSDQPRIAGQTATAPTSLRLVGGAEQERPRGRRRFVGFAMSFASLAACLTLGVLLWPATVSPSAAGKVSPESSGLDSAFSLADSIDEHFSLDAYDALLAEADTMDRTLTSDLNTEIELPAES